MNKKIFAALSVVALTSCALLNIGKIDWTKPQSFQNKTGVIGVLRVGDSPCRGYEGSGSGFLVFGKKDNLWVGLDEHSTDGLFGKDLTPGSHRLNHYSYNCTVGYKQECNKKNECHDRPIIREFIKKPESRFALNIPANGFCKVLISFRDNVLQAGQDDDFLRDYFIENNVALEFDEVPYCEVKQSETFAQ